MDRFILYVALLVVGYVIIYAILNRRIKRSIDPRSLLETIREEVDRIIVELNSTTDRNITLVEDKITRLGELLEQVDRKIGLLKREKEKHDLAVKLYTDLGENRVTGAEEKQEDVGGKVLRLHRQGISASMIARQLRIALAEIELIVSLAEKTK